MSKLESEIKLRESVPNKDRRFGSSNEYLPVRITDSHGEEKPALFTRGQIAVAIERAKRNLEDLPADWNTSWYSWLLMDL